MPATTPTKAQKSPLTIVLIRRRPAPAPAEPAPPYTRLPTHKPRLHWSLRQAYGSCRPSPSEEALRPQEESDDEQGKGDDRLVDRVDAARKAAPGRELHRE